MSTIRIQGTVLKSNRESAVSHPDLIPEMSEKKEKEEKQEEEEEEEKKGEEEEQEKKEELKKGQPSIKKGKNKRK